MAVADGYAMLRNPGCVPFVRPLSQVGFHRPDQPHDRSSVSGQFVSADEAAEHPDVTVHEGGGE